MKLSGSLMTLVMLAIFIGLVGVASTYPADARFMPFVVGLPAIGLCLLQLVLDLRRRSRPLIPSQDPPAEMGAAAPEEILSAQEIRRREWTVWVAFLGLLGGILLFGFWIAIPLFIVSFLRFQAKASWLLSLALGIGMTLLLFLVLERAFQMELHRGFIVDYLQERMES